MLSFQQVTDAMSAKLATMPSGYLPKWLLFISVVAVFNSVQTYISGLELTRKVYEKNPQEVTPLSARTFGTWTLISSFIRLYGALYLNENHVFQLTFISYMIALFHFASEWLVYRTCKFGKGILGPLIVSSTSLIWMYCQKEYYTGSGW